MEEIFLWRASWLVLLARYDKGDEMKEDEMDGGEVRTGFGEEAWSTEIFARHRRR